jgi:hypothetical protein
MVEINLNVLRGHFRGSLQPILRAFKMASKAITGRASPCEGVGNLFEKGSCICICGAICQLQISTTNWKFARSIQLILIQYGSNSGGQIIFYYRLHNKFLNAHR